MTSTTDSQHNNQTTVAGQALQTQQRSSEAAGTGGGQRRDAGARTTPHQALRRWGAAVAPAAVTAGVQALGEVLHQAHAAPVALLGGTPAALAGVIAAVRLLRTDRLRWWAASTIGAGWLTTVVESLAGAGWPLAGLVWAAGAALGLPWWWRLRDRAPEPDPVPEPEPVPVPAVVEPGPDPEAVRITQVWEQRVACAGPAGALPGSRMGEPARTRYGWTAVISLPPGGQHTAEHAIAAARRVCGAYELPAGSVAIDYHPDGFEHLATLTILTRNPLHEEITWQGPNYDPATGRSRLGIYADGNPARYLWWVERLGPLHDLIAGTTGSGKSALLSQLLATERHSGMLSVLIDPQGGQSAPEWVDKVHRFAGDLWSGIELLEAVRDDMYARNNYLANLEWTDGKGRRRRGVPRWSPDCGLPLMVVTIEEAHTILATKEGKQVVEEIAKMCRKCGIKLRLIVQVPLLTQLGNSMTLRDMLVGGNVIVLRTANQMSGRIAFNGNLPVDPSRIPRVWPHNGRTTAGVGFLLSADLRAMQMRLDNVPDDDVYDWATTGVPAAEHRIDRAAFGRVGLGWNPQRAAAAKAAAESRGATTSPASEAGTELDDLMDAAVEINPAFSELGEAMAGLAAVIPLRPAPAAPANQAGQAGGRATVADQVMALLADGATWSTGDLATRIGCTDRAVRLALDQLRTAGQVIPAGHGRHQKAA